MFFEKFLKFQFLFLIKTHYFTVLNGLNSHIIKNLYLTSVPKITVVHCMLFLAESVELHVPPFELTMYVPCP